MAPNTSCASSISADELMPIALACIWRVSSLACCFPSFTAPSPEPRFFLSASHDMPISSFFADPRGLFEGALRAF